VRIEPVIFELERATNDILIVAQSSVLRCLLAYLQGLKPHEIPSVEIHEGELIECSPMAYGIQTRKHVFWDAENSRKERDVLFYKQRQQGAGSAIEDDAEVTDGEAAEAVAAAKSKLAQDPNLSGALGIETDPNDGPGLEQVTKGVQQANIVDR
jgi:6-phosphofructo-2-kinase / fructose-2,6-biphosphatase 4